ncbi:MAG: hypothetical protein ACPG3X_05555 [Opitutales bacterium]
MERFKMSGTSIQILLLGCLSVLPCSVFADESLSKKSPFLPPDHGTKTSVPAQPKVQPQGPISREIEFRGVVQLGGTYRFSLFNKKQNKSYWIEEKVSQDGLSVRSFDAGSSTVVVNVNGRSERLTLMTATDSPLPVALNHSQSKLPQAPVLPPQINPPQNKNSTKRVIPRRRVILPTKDN